jgi:hypothetical protein
MLIAGISIALFFDHSMGLTMSYARGGRGAGSGSKVGVEPVSNQSEQILL